MRARGSGTAFWSLECNVYSSRVFLVQHIVHYCVTTYNIIDAAWLVMVAWCACQQSIR